MLELKGGRVEKVRVGMLRADLGNGFKLIN